MSFDFEQMKQQLSMLKELVKIMDPEQKKQFQALWLVMYKEMFVQ